MLETGVLGLLVGVGRKPQQSILDLLLSRGSDRVWMDRQKFLKDLDTLAKERQVKLAGDHALYVWRSPEFHGIPTDPFQGVQRMADFAIAEDISTINYDNFGCGDGCGVNGAERQDAETVANIDMLTPFSFQILTV